MSKIEKILSSTEESPEVVFNPESATLSITGVCMPENAVTTFSPIFDRLQNITSSVSSLNVEFSFKYLNSMSSKQVLRLIDTIVENSNGYSINWYYDNGDTLMMMKGEEIKEILELENFNIIEGN